MAWEGGRVLGLIFYLLLAWLALKLGVLLLNLLLFPTLRPASSPARGVSLLVPARNEAANLEKTLPGLLQQEAQEILVLDDGSTDATAQVVARFAQQDPRLRLIPGQPKPEGWLGKSWACWQLAQAAQGQVLLFTDADVYWQPGALAAVQALLEQSRAGLVSVYPHQRTLGLAERVLLPLIDDALLCYLPHPLLATPFPLAAAANGQVMAFVRPAYWAAGGHAAVRAEVLEDVRLAQRVKAAGGGLGLALGGRLIAVRMYRSYAALVEGLGKNLIAFHGQSRLLLGFSYAGHLLAYTLCWPLALWDTRWLALGCLGLLERVLLGWKTARPAWEALLLPLAPLLALPIYLRAGQGRYTWKGRAYTRWKPS